MSAPLFVWCGPCQGHIPVAANALELLPGRRVRVVKPCCGSLVVTPASRVVLELVARLLVVDAAAEDAAVGVLWGEIEAAGDGLAAAIVGASDD